MGPHQIATWPQHLPHQLSTPQTNVYFNLAVSATRFPEKPVLIDRDGILTYRSLVSYVDQLAGFLESTLNVQEGECVMIYMQNCREFMIAYYAILRLGAVVVPVNPMNKSGELVHYLSDSRARTVFCSHENIDQFSNVDFSEKLDLVVAGNTQITDKLPSTKKELVVHGFDSVIAINEAVCRPLNHDPTLTAVVLYSSGTTGKPKGCLHTHETLMAGLNTVANWMTMDVETVVLAVLPYFHITGMQTLMNAPIYIGGTVVLLERWDRDAAAELISRYKVTHWTTMPTMIIDFLASPNLQRYELSSLKRIGGGGAGMPDAVAERINRLTGLNYLEGYGLSEGMPFTGNPASGFKRQCLGVPLFNTDVRIVDPETLQELSQGEIGEIAVSSDKLFRGYWQNNEATNESFFTLEAKHFFRTGDLGYMDKEGYFFIVDRLKRMINASGYKVWPTEIEATLHKHPSIQEACVIAAKDPYRGETVKALIVLYDRAKGCVSPDDIVGWSKARMAAYKYPRLIEFVDELPKLASGKIAWRYLQEQENTKG